MPNPGKKRAATWCVFCEIGGHTREECRRWAACLRDTVMATHAAMAKAHKPQSKANPKKKARRGGKQRDKKRAHNAAPSSLPPRPPTPASSAGASGPAALLKITATTEGSPGMDQPDLLSRLGQFSQSEVEFLVRALKGFRERNSPEDFAGKPLIKDEPSQEEPAQGPCVESDAAEGGE
ncbi:hypothetical protein N7472_002042 [Penicillium cf. griseofulvum]|uniref:Uncharacterized protein n=1 Tax=Penicillium cf. griseofulvum TaxID=2972120 RepID=A0A9W9T152_9EURO|nr:hypothetical protein N7472_002042 [Penicillium cf. griseofulvum]